MFFFLVNLSHCFGGFLIQSLYLSKKKKIMVSLFNLMNLHAIRRKNLLKGIMFGLMTS